MTNESEKIQTVRRPRPSLFFPLLLIAVGLVLLLKTLGVINGDLWDMFLKVWPILFIVSGLDSIYRRDGIVGGVVWAGLGAIILLANLGYIAPVYWDVVLRIWPFALVVWGLDLLLGKRTWFISIFAFLTGIVVLGMVFYVMMSEPVIHSINNETFQVQPEDALQANIDVEVITGRLIINDGAAADNLADGTVKLPSNEEMIVSYMVQEDTGQLSIKSDESENSQYWFPNTGNTRQWQVNLSGAIPMDISSNLTVGEQIDDFTGLALDDIQIETVVGRSVITLPETVNGMIDLSQVVGDMVIYVPQNVPVSFEMDTAMTALDYPDDFTRTGDIIQSPDGDSDDALHVKVSVPLGSVRIRYAE